MEPALKRDSNTDVSLGVRIVGVLVEAFGPVSLISLETDADNLKGVVASVGLELLFCCCAGLIKVEPAFEGNLEGMVPARARRVGLSIVFSEGGRKSGNPS